MKKYLMTGIAALAMCAAFTSCSKDPGFEQTTPEQLAQAQYDAAFIKAFGQPAANQDWGFGTNATRSFTRANEGSVIKPDMTNFPGYSNERCNSSNYRSPEGYADIVAPVTDKEREWVMDWFSKNPGLTPQGQPFKNFFVQNVGNNGHTKAGYFHSTEGGKPESVEAKSYDGIYMDKLQIGATASEADTEHTLDFNATNGFNAWNLIYYENSSALQFGYHESYGDSYEWYFKCVELEVPGSCFADGKARKGWYVGLSYYCDKKETNEKWHVIGGDRLQYGDDWVLKIVPNDPVSEPNYRVIAEDLNASEKTDFDFNDVIFDVIPNGTSSADIKAIAAGGIYKLTVNGVEVHEKFGESANADGTYPMINTGAGPTHEPVVLCNIQGDFTGSDAPAKIRNIVIKVYKPGFEESGVELTATTGKPACKILVDDTFGVVTERQDISNEYGNFTSWVQGYFADDFWWKSGTAE